MIIGLQMKLNPWIGVTNMEVCSELGLHFTYSKVSHLFEKKKKRHTHNMDNVCQTMELGLVQERDNKIGKENNVLLHENI